MVEGNALFAYMFGSMKPIQGTVIEHPGLFGGVDYTTSSGEHLGSLTEGPFGLELHGPNGEMMGNVHDNVYGSITVDMAHGPDITGMPGALGDQYLMGNEWLGYETGNIYGGTDLVGTGGEHLAVGTEGLFGSNQFELNNSFGDMPDFSGFSDFSVHSFDAVNFSFDAGSAADAMDAMDAIGTLDLLTGFF